MDTTTRLHLPFLLPNQAQKHVTLNDALQRLDLLTGLLVRSRLVSLQPESPAPGDIYILPEAPSGDSWTSLPAGSLVCFEDGVWSLLPAPQGLRAWIEDEATLFIAADEGWVPAIPASLPRLGIGTGADETNRLAVKSDAVLLSHDDVTPGSGDMRLAINRLAPANAASVLFQTSDTGHGEVGLGGTSDLDLRTSPDGTTFTTGLRVRSSDAKVSFPAGLSDPLSVLGQIKLRFNAGTIADDAVSSVSFGELIYGAALLAVPNTLTSGPLVFFFARMAPTPALTPLFSGGHTFTHGTAELTGTTGADGGINFAATADGRFLIENRRGYSVNYTVYLFR